MKAAMAATIPLRSGHSTNNVALFFTGCSRPSSSCGAFREHPLIGFPYLLCRVLPGKTSRPGIAAPDQCLAQVLLGEDLADAAGNVEHIIRIHQQGRVAKYLG